MSSATLFAIVAHSHVDGSTKLLQLSSQEPEDLLATVGQWARLNEVLPSEQELRTGEPGEDGYWLESRGEHRLALVQRSTQKSTGWFSETQEQSQRPLADIQVLSIADSQLAVELGQLQLDALYHALYDQVVEQKEELALDLDQLEQEKKDLVVRLRGLGCEFDKANEENEDLIVQMRKAVEENKDLNLRLKTLDRAHLAEVQHSQTLEFELTQRLAHVESERQELVKQSQRLEAELLVQAGDAEVRIHALNEELYAQEHSASTEYAALSHEFDLEVARRRAVEARCDDLVNKSEAEEARCEELLVDLISKNAKQQMLESELDDALCESNRFGEQLFEAQSENGALRSDLDGTQQELARVRELCNEQAELIQQQRENLQRAAESRVELAADNQTLVEAREDLTMLCDQLAKDNDSLRDALRDTQQRREDSERELLGLCDAFEAQNEQLTRSEETIRSEHEHLRELYGAAQERIQELSTRSYLLQNQVEEHERELERCRKERVALERSIRETARLEAELLQDNLLKAWELEELRHRN